MIPGCISVSEPRTAPTLRFAGPAARGRPLPLSQRISWSPFAKASGSWLPTISNPQPGSPEAWAVAARSPFTGLGASFAGHAVAPGPQVPEIYVVRHWKFMAPILMGCCGLTAGNAQADSRFGAAWGFLYGYRGTQAETFMPQLRQLGGGMTKIYLFWNQVEPRKGELNWAAV